MGRFEVSGLKRSGVEGLECIGRFHACNSQALYRSPNLSYHAEACGEGLRRNGAGPIAEFSELAWRFKGDNE